MPGSEGPTSSYSPMHRVFDKAMSGGFAASTSRLAPSLRPEESFGHFLYKWDRLNIAPALEAGGSYRVGPGDLGKIDSLLRKHQSLVFTSGTFEHLKEYMGSTYGKGMAGFSDALDHMSHVRGGQFLLTRGRPAAAGLSPQDYLYFGSGGPDSYRRLPVQAAPGGLGGAFMTYGKSKTAPIMARATAGGITQSSLASEYYRVLGGVMAQSGAGSMDTIEAFQRAATQATKVPLTSSLRGPSIGATAADSVKFKLDRPLVTFDVETTGLGDDAKIWNIAATKMDPSGAVSKMDLFLDPGQEFEPGATRLAGMTRSKIKGMKGVTTMAAAKGDILDFFQGADLAGYNVGFDIARLEAEVGPLGKRRTFDPMEIARRGKARPVAGGGLASMYKFYVGSDMPGRAHFAGADVAATLRLLKAQMAVHFSGTPDPEMSVLYEKIQSGAFKPISASMGMGQGHSFRDLVRAAPRIRGRSTAANEMWSAQRQYVMMDEHAAVISSMQRFQKGMTMEAQGIFRGDPAMIREGIRLKREHSETLLKEFDTLGLGHAHALVKPEQLMGMEGGFALPSKALVDAFGPAYTKRMATKGMFQRYRSTNLTGGQVKQLIRNNLRPGPSYMTKGQYGLSREVVGAIDQQVLKTAFVDFESPVWQGLIMGDSGGLLTPLGSAAFAKQQDLGSITIRGYGQDTLAQIEEVFGVRLEDATFDANARAYTYSPNQTVNPRRMKRPAARALRRRSQDQLGVWNLLRGRRDKAGTVLRELQIKEDSVVLHFGTQRAVPARNVSVVGSGARTTLTAVSGSHRFDQLLNTLAKSYGVGAVLPLSEAGKMFPRNLFLTNYTMVGAELARGNAKTAASYGLSVAEARRAGQQMLAAVALDSKAPLALPGRLGNIDVAVVTDEASAMAGANRILDKFKTSTSNKIVKLGTMLAQGMELSTDMLSKGYVGGLGIGDEGIRGSYVAYQQRPDAYINPENPIRMRASKLRNIGVSSQLLGYAQPIDDPLFSLLNARLGQQIESRTGRTMAGSVIDPITGDMKVPSNVRDYLGYMWGTEGMPANAGVIGMKNGQMTVTRGGKEIAFRNLPGVDEFRYLGAGVSKERLAGTILDPAARTRHGLQGVPLFADLGDISPVTLGSGRYGTRGVSTPGMQHVPVPLDLVRFAPNMAGQSIVSGSDVSMGYLKTLGAIQAGAGGKELRNIYNQATRSMIRALPGKGGVLDKIMSANIHSGVSVRAQVPHGKTTALGSFSNLEEMYTVRVARGDLQGYIDRMQGLKGRDIAHLQKLVNAGESTYIALGADPMQRGEHMVVAKLQLMDKVSPLEKSFVKTGEMGMEVHPALMRILERDHDMDRLAVLFVEAMKGGSKHSHLWKHRMTQQMRFSRSTLAMAKYEMLMEEAGVKKFEDVFSEAMRSIREKSTAAERLAWNQAYLASKASAARGYTTTRAVDRFMPFVGLPTGESAARYLTSMGVDTKGITSEITYLTEELFGNKKMAAMAETMAQAMYQGGIIKGGSKSALEGLYTGLASVSYRAKHHGISLQQGIQEAQGLFQSFFDDMSADGGKMRHHWAMDYLAERGKFRPALDKMVADLEAGAHDVKTVEAMRKRINLEAAEVMSQYYGAGYWLRGKEGTMGVYDAMSVTEMGKAGDMVARQFASRPENIVTRLLRPIIGAGAVGAAATAGVGEVAAQAAREASTSTFSSRLASIFEGRKGLFIAGGIGAIAGFMGARATEPIYEDAPLPPEPLVNQDEYYGPTGPIGPDPARIPMNHPAPMTRGLNTRAYSRIGNLNSAFGGANGAEIIVRDQSSSMSSYEMERRMKQISNSDYSR